MRRGMQGGPLERTQDRREIPRALKASLPRQWELGEKLHVQQAMEVLATKGRER